MIQLNTLWEALLIKGILCIAAAFFKATADIVNFRKGGKFKKLFANNKLFKKYPLFFDMGKQYMIPHTSYPFTAWHVANSLMIGCFLLATLFTGFRWYTDILVMSVLFVMPFNLFYDKILR
jgi:hypothetical protein